MLERIRNNPVLVAAAFTAIINVIVAFGVSLSGDQVGTLNVAIVAILAVVVR